MNSTPFLRNLHKQAILALIITNVIWGAASPIFKLALQNIPPFTLAYFRFAGAALILLPFCYGNLKIEKKDWWDLLLLSFFGITLNIIFFFFGLKHAPAINAPVIASSGPIFIYLFSIFFLREKPHSRVIIGLLTSLIGVLIIVCQPILEKGFGGIVLGNIFFILATIGAVGHVIFSKRILAKYPPKTITFWSFTIGTFTFLPFFLFEILTSNSIPMIDYRGWIGFVFGIFFSSLLAYFLFEWGTKQLPAQEVGIFAYIDPIAAILIAIPLLGETITLVFLLGSVLIFSGVYIAEGRIPYHPLHKLRS